MIVRRRVYDHELPMLSSVVLHEGKNPVEVYPLVIGLASKVWGRVRSDQMISAEYRDAVSEGLLALLQAHTRFRGRRKVKLTTFAYRRIKGAVQDFLIREMRYVTRFEPYAPEDLPHTAVDGINARISNELLFRKVLIVMIEVLPEFHRFILTEHYLKNRPLRDLATGSFQNIREVQRIRNEALLLVRRFFPSADSQPGTFVASEN